MKHEFDIIFLYKEGITFEKYQAFHELESIRLVSDFVRLCLIT